jgi:arsenite methyltransferase
MSLSISCEDKKQILDSIRKKYIQVAASPAGLFRYPTGRAGLEFLGYDSAWLQQLPAAVLASYCGVGNPFSLGPLQAGDRVLDIGCGAGVDAIIAALLVGQSGQVVGIDLVPEILDRARQNAELVRLDNLSFEEASAENLPFDDNSFSVVISNGVLNLVVDKTKALQEIFRVMQPGGRLQIADQVLKSDIDQDPSTQVANWFR